MPSAMVRSGNHAPLRRMLAGLLCLLTVWLLSSCHAMRERRRALELRQSGDLSRARSVLQQLVEEVGEPADREALGRVESELCRLHMEDARWSLGRGDPLGAYQALVCVLEMEPLNLEARLLADRIWSGYRAEELQARRFEVALRAERWEEALSIAAAPLPSLPPGAQSFHPLLADDRRHWVPELFGRVWRALDEGLEQIDRRGGAPLMEALCQRAEELRQDFHTQVEGYGLPMNADLVRWRGRTEDRREGDRLWSEARRLRSRAEHAGSWRLYQRALFLLSRDGTLRAEALAERDTLALDLSARMESAASRRDWGPALRAVESLKELGRLPELAAGVTPGEMRRRHHAALVARARVLERQGLLGSALLALAEVSLDPLRRKKCAAEVERLRGALLARPIVEQRRPGALPSAPPAGDPPAPVVVEIGHPGYTEWRESTVETRSGPMQRTGVLRRGNPAYEADVRRWRVALEEVLHLCHLWLASSRVHADHVRRRCSLRSAELWRIAERVRALRPTERLSTWRSVEVPVEVVDMRARLELPLVIRSPGGEPERRSIVAELKLREQLPPASPEERIPGPNAGIPTPAQVRARPRLAPLLLAAAVFLVSVLGHEANALFAPLFVLVLALALTQR
ncbi:MAG: hypothetical protein ACE5GW_10465, partial [Planctomycetota bacterium]